jgi:hypothetical protein
VKPVPEICEKCDGVFSSAEKTVLNQGAVRTHHHARFCGVKHGFYEVPGDCPFLTEMVLHSGETEVGGKMQVTHIVGWDIDAKSVKWKK